MSASAIETADIEGYPVNTHIRMNEHAPSLDDASFDKMFAGLPLVTYRVGETVLTAGSNTGRLLILKRGEVAIIKDFIEIARVKEPGAVIGELSVLLGQPHTADVQALEDSQFHVADGGLLAKDSVMVLHVAKILARRLIAADGGLVELNKQLNTGQSPNVLSETLIDIEETLSSGMTNTSHSKMRRYY
jgi:CRP-like cAMP-binding protein